MVAAIAHGEVDALLFTSQVQCRHLMQIAERLGAADDLRAGLHRIVVGAIGPVCAGALRTMGIVPDVIPALPNSPSLVRAVADYFALTTDGDT
jgi:uroporphyrinogen-III synthase